MKFGIMITGPPLKRICGAFPGGEAPAPLTSICQGVGAIPSPAQFGKVLGSFLALAQILDEVGRCPRAVLVLRWCRIWSRKLLLCSLPKTGALETSLKGGSLKSSLL